MICIRAQLVPLDHEIHSIYFILIISITLSNLIKFLSSYAMSQDVSNENAKKAGDAHFVPKMFNPNDAVNSPHTIFSCSNDCLILSQSVLCNKCRKF